LRTSPENIPPEPEKLLAGEPLSFEELQRLLSYENLPLELRAELENGMSYLENFPPNCVESYSLDKKSKLGWSLNEAPNGSAGNQSSNQRNKQNEKN
jgi:hypothetical protein